MNGAAAVVEFLKAAGATRTFGVVGESVLDVTDAIRDDATMRYVPVRHEGAGALAASGYGRSARSPAICLGHIGAGASNLVNGLADAYKDDAPVIAVTGNADTADLGRDGWHELDHMTMFEPVTRWNVRLGPPERLVQQLRESVYRLNTGAPGPIHLDLPTDVARAELPDEATGDLEAALARVPSFTAEHNRVTPPENVVRAAVDRFRDAENPMVLAGGGVAWSRAGDALASLAEYARVPVLTSLTARGVVDERHGYCFGALGTLGRIAAKRVADDADFLLAVGSPLSDIETFGWSLFRDVPIVQVTLDETDLGKQYSVAESAVADPRAFLAAFDAELRRQTDGPLPDPEAIEGYREELDAEFEAILHPDPEDRADTDAGLVNPYAVLAALGDRLGPDDIICSASGKNTLWSSLLPIAEPGTFLKSVGLGTMGFAFPAGIGAKTARPDAEVVVVAGDGDFSMVVQELETAARESLPVTVVVFNDSELSSIKTQQAAHYEERFVGVDYTDVDFAAVAEGFNATGHRVETGAAFEAALDAALAADSPSVVDVRTDPTIEAPSLFYESES